MDLVTLTYFNKIPEFIPKAHYLHHHGLYVGVPRGNQFLTMVAITQEYGAHIQAHNKSGFLWIPTPAAQGKRPRDIPDLYVRQRKGSDTATAGYNNSYSPNGFCVCFILKHSINIPARAFIRKCVDDNERIWNSLIALKLAQVMLQQVSLDDFYRIIGNRITNDLKDTITKFSQPPNAALTVENKGKNDPLVDTGKLRDSITAVKL